MKRTQHSWTKIESALKPMIRRSGSNKNSNRSLNSSRAPLSRRLSITSAPEHPTIPTSLLSSLFKAKCEDMQIPILPDQEFRFLTLSLSCFKDRFCSLSDSNFKEKSVLCLCAILKQNHFAYIDLSRNSLGDSGSILLFKKLKNCLSIVHVDISNNEISSEAAVQICKFLAVHPSITSFDISSYEGLKRNRVGVQGAEAIKQVLQTNSVLQVLALAGTGLGEGILLLAKGLINNSALISLNISNNCIEAQHVEELCKAISNSSVQKLNLSLNKIGDQGAKALACLLSSSYIKCCPLVYLDVAENFISDKGAVEVFQALRFNSIVQEFNAAGNAVGKGLPLFIASFFSDNCALVKLDLSNAQINSKALVNIYEGLSRNKRLEVLSLAGNRIESEGVKLLAAGLAKNKKLCVVDLSSCHIKDTGTEFLVKFLRNNSSLNTLALKNNGLKDRSAENLLNLARIKTNLRSIQLEQNQINVDLLNSLKGQLRSNKLLITKQLVPKILSEIERIRGPIDEFSKNHKETKKKLKKNKEIEDRRFNSVEMINEAKEREEKLMQAVKDEYLKAKSEGIAKSVVLEELKNEEIKIRIGFEKQVREIANETRKVEIEIDAMKRVCDSISSSFFLARTEVVEKVQSYKHKLRSAAFENSVAKDKLLSLREELNRKQNEILLYKNTSKIPAQFLATHKLAENKAKYSPQKRKISSRVNSKSLSILL